MLAAGAVGGVATATTGVLPVPFGGGERAVPGASVSAEATPERSPGPPPPSSTTSDGPGTAAPGDATAVPSDDGDRDTAGDFGVTPGATSGAAPGHGPTASPGDTRDRAADRRGRLVAACRDLRGGKTLDTGRKRALEERAGGSARVWKYCRGLLKPADGRTGVTDGRNNKNKKWGKDRDGRDGKGGRKDRGAQGEQGEQGGRGGRGDDEGGHKGGPGVLHKPGHKGVHGDSRKGVRAGGRKDGRNGRHKGGHGDGRHHGKSAVARPGPRSGPSPR